MRSGGAGLRGLGQGGVIMRVGVGLGVTGEGRVSVRWEESDGEVRVGVRWGKSGGVGVREKSCVEVGGWPRHEGCGTGVPWCGH